MNEAETHAANSSPEPDRPERWDEAIVAGYIYELLRPGE